MTTMSSTVQQLPAGGVWTIPVTTRDAYGYLISTDVPTVVVTLPNGTTAAPTFTLVTSGQWRASYTVALPGRYVAHVTTTTGALDFAAYVSAPTTGANMPTTDDVADYLGPDSHTVQELQDALDAEAAAQRAVCRVGAVYPDDLRQALLRRVARNLAMRRLPLALTTGDAEIGPTVLPGRDPEVRRFEAPYRKLVTA